MYKLEVVKREMYAKLKHITKNYIFESNQIISQVCSIPSTKLNFYDKIISPGEYAKITQMCDKRCTGYPLQYIIGEWDFYGNSYIVNSGVLIPRPDTEVLCETILNISKGKKNLLVADLCTGTGCIAITLEKNLLKPDVHAFEQYDDAYEVLLQNIYKHKSSIYPHQLDILLEPIPIKDIDIVVSNPPYLSKNDILRIRDEISFEPLEALYGGDDGLEFYRVITQKFTPLMNQGGLIAFEIGINQEIDVCNILKDNGYSEISFAVDMNKIIRVIYAFKS